MQMSGFETGYEPSILQQARDGSFRAIAYWLNICLVPQGIFARVGESQTGNLLVLVEFERTPDRDRLIRFVCDRLWRLQSRLIRGVQIVAHQVGADTPLWAQSVRFTIQPRSHARTKTARPRPKARRVTPPRQKVEAPPFQMPTLPYKEFWSKKPHSVILGGSAVAAFAIGCGVEALTQYSTAPTLATQSTVTETQPSETVQAALEQVPVIQADTGVNPTDPTVTLFFGNDAALESERLAQANAAFDSIASQSPEGGITPDPTLSPNATHPQPIDLAMTNLDDRLLGQADATEAHLVQELAIVGVDVINVANDPILKGGRAGLTQTLENLDQAGIHAIGAGRSATEARRPEIIEVRGQRIAYFGYTDAEQNVAQGNLAGLNVASEQHLADDIQAIRNQVDWVIVNYHWSQDLTEYPEEQQRKLARSAIDHGADLVIGYHPTTLQGAEVYNGRAIAYSLGNFVFQNSDPSQADYDTAALKVSLRDRQMRLEFLPIQVRDSKPEIAQGDTAHEILHYLDQVSADFEEPLQSPMVLEAQLPDRDPAEQPMLAPAPEPFTSDESFPPNEAPADAVVPSLEAAPTEGMPLESREESSPKATSDSFISYPEETEEAIDATAPEATPSSEPAPEAIDSPDPQLLTPEDFPTPPPNL